MRAATNAGAPAERRQILGHAWTVWLGQLAVMAFGIVDTVVAGRDSNESLAALSVGSAISISVHVALIGVIQSLLPVFSELHGAGKPQALGQQFKQAVYLGLALVMLGMGFMLLPGALLAFTDVPASLQPLVRGYLEILAWGMLPSIGFRLFGTLHQSIGLPRVVTAIQLAALVLKAPLSALLTFGVGGWSGMGVLGCAWATFIVNYAMLGMALALLLTQDRYKPMQLFSHWQTPQPGALGHMLRLGVPAGLSYLVEVTSFTLMALYIARLGAVSSAAHQIAANLTAVLYMMPLSLAIATSARVGYWRGAGHADRAEQAVKTGYGISVPLGLGFALLLVLGASWLAGLYTQDTQVRQLATGLLVWVGVYHLADGVQCMTGFVLRCYRVTVAPFVLYAVILWALGLMGGYWLCYRGLPGVAAMQSPLAFWLAGTAALYLVAVCLLWLLRRTLRQHRKR